MRFLVAFVLILLAGVVGGFFGYLFGWWGLIPSVLLGVPVGFLAGSIASG